MAPTDILNPLTLPSCGISRTRDRMWRLSRPARAHMLASRAMQSLPSAVLLTALAVAVMVPRLTVPSFGLLDDAAILDLARQTLDGFAAGQLYPSQTAVRRPHLRVRLGGVSRASRSMTRDDADE